jgi:hypothetical protein
MSGVHSKHVEPSINFGIINSISKLHLVGISTESSTMHVSMNIKKRYFLDNRIRTPGGPARSPSHYTVYTMTDLYIKYIDFVLHTYYCHKQ